MRDGTCCVLDRRTSVLRRRCGVSRPVRAFFAAATSPSRIFSPSPAVWKPSSLALGFSNRRLRCGRFLGSWLSSTTHGVDLASTNALTASAEDRSVVWARRSSNFLKTITAGSDGQSGMAQGAGMRAHAAVSSSAQGEC